MVRVGEPQRVRNWRSFFRARADFYISSCYSHHLISKPGDQYLSAFGSIFVEASGRMLPWGLRDQVWTGTRGNISGTHSAPLDACFHWKRHHQWPIFIATLWYLWHTQHTHTIRCRWNPASHARGAPSSIELNGPPLTIIHFRFYFPSCKPRLAAFVFYSGPSRRFSSHQVAKCRQRYRRTLPVCALLCCQVVRNLSRRLVRVFIKMFSTFNLICSQIKFKYSAIKASEQISLKLDLQGAVAVLVRRFAYLSGWPFES